jgi:predicted kinase
VTGPARREARAVPLPTLAVVSGPPGAGKTTLARELARHLGCPAVVRDEIKQGMVLAARGPGAVDRVPVDHAKLDHATLDAFFGALAMLLRSGVTVVAEAAYQDRLWRPGLDKLVGLAHMRIVRCAVEPAVARDRIRRRGEHDVHRAAHADRELLAELDSGRRTLGSFAWISLDAPTLVVDTSSGYEPRLDHIADFVAAP